jgi:hypothetical protein
LGIAVAVCLAASAASGVTWTRTKGPKPTPAWNGGLGVPPRIGGALGIVPAHGHFDLAAGEPIDAVYHGGDVMGPGVTVHTLFWAPAGYSFGGSPGPEPAVGVTGLLGTIVGAGGQIPGFEALQQQFFTDVAHDSG